MAILSKYSDEQLFDRVKNGDHAAFTEIYERYWGVLFIQAFKIIKNEEKAMDVIQDIFTVLWENAGDSDIQLSLKAYLYTSVRNRLLDALRRQAVADKYLDSLVQYANYGYDDTEETVIFNELSHLLEAGVAGLPEKMQRVFRMSWMEGQSHNQIAAELNITVHTVKKTISRARQVLRARFLEFFLLVLLVECGF